MTDLKILVFSDTHRAIRYMEEAVRMENPDQVIHLGDHMGDAEELSRLFPKLPVLMVRGNCDYGNIGREEVLTEFRGHRFLLCHGHTYGVKTGLLRYTLAAREKQVDVALFGHTHRACCEEAHGIWFLNPGSCNGIDPTYGIIHLDENSLCCEIKNFTD